MPLIVILKIIHNKFLLRGPLLPLTMEILLICLYKYNAWVKKSYCIHTILEDALTSLDGRNRHKLHILSPYFSEIALNKERIFVELHYLKSLSNHNVIRSLKKSEIAFMDNIVQSFDSKDYKSLREIETTN